MLLNEPNSFPMGEKELWKKGENVGTPAWRAVFSCWAAHWNHLQCFKNHRFWGTLWDSDTLSWSGPAHSRFAFQKFPAGSGAHVVRFRSWKCPQLIALTLCFTSVQTRGHGLVPWVGACWPLGVEVMVGLPVYHSSCFLPLVRASLCSLYLGKAIKHRFPGQPAESILGRFAKV